jgi:hypothetical protein
MTNVRTVEPQRVDAAFIEVIAHGDGFALALDGEVLRTAEASIEVCHQARELLEHFVSEFDGHGHVEIADGAIVGPTFFGSFGFFTVQKKMEPRRDECLSTAFAECLLSDPVLHPVAGPEQVDQYARWSPIRGWLGERYSRLCGLAAEIPHWLGEEEFLDRETAMARARDDQGVLELADEYSALAPEQRAVVLMLYHIHEGSVLFPMALVLGKCTDSDYALGVMAGRALLSTAFGDVEDSDHREIFESLRADARAGLDYIRFYREGTADSLVRELVAVGENTLQEFKSTLRWNLHTDKKDPEMTHACLKTIAAFLNTKGGKLMIGVADNGDIVGIERDGFPNHDKFLLHLTNAVKNSLGESSATCIEADIVSVDQLSICVVDCRKSPRPVYCATKGAGEKFYVRTGPGTTSLPPSKVVDYVQDHFATVAGKAD